MSNGYVLVTPMRNEEATIGITIESILAQTVSPREWVIVSDGSTDGSDAIIRRYAADARFIRLVSINNRNRRSFSSVVSAIEAGCAELQCRDYAFIGILDADVRLPPDYYEIVVSRFAANPSLGLGGGLVLDMDGKKGKVAKQRQNMEEVAGAVQLFRRECFESLGGLLPILEGGWDTVTCVRARMNGYKTMTFPDVRVDHLKPRNSAEGNLIRRTWQMGTRDYAVGNEPTFEIVKCFSRLFEAPCGVGPFVRLTGYLWACLARRKRILDPEVVNFIRSEQRLRIRNLFGGAK